MSARRRTIDVGFEPETSPHHFAVRVEAGGRVVIVERHAWGEDAQADAGREKAVLDAYRWERIAQRAMQDFNHRLRAGGARAARWKRGETLLAAHFGKELTLLAWAVEDADPTVIPNMLGNWVGLAPEERWWLYTTINATFTRPEDPDRGWRRAIKIAFAENPVDAPPSALLATPPPVPREDRPAARPRRGGGKGQPAEAQISMDLPGIQEAAAGYDPDDPAPEEEQQP